MRTIRQIRKVLDIIQLRGVPFRDLLRPGFSLSAHRLVAAIAEYCPALGSIIDVGANKGQFTQAALTTFPGVTILCVEPLPDLAGRLRRRFAGESQVEIFATALSNESGPITFYRNRYTQVSSALSIAADNNHPDYQQSAATEITVPCARLDDIVTRSELSPPVLLKLDVQGYEQQVLKGAARTLEVIDWVVLECAFVQLYEEQALFDDTHAALNGAGYKVVAPLAINQSPDGRIIEMDVLYARNPE